MDNEVKDEQVTAEELEVATLGGGCFWCLEAIFEEVRGVRDAVSGYAGGHAADPTYREVCRGDTGHAEVVQVTFDSQVISFREILEIFFDVHDPTTLNRQGADIGSQYRSIILYHSSRQREIAEQVIEELDRAGRWESPIVTEVEPIEAFYEAEDYHQGYFRENPRQPYCRVVVAPKVAKFRERHGPSLKGQAG